MMKTWAAPLGIAIAMLSIGILDAQETVDSTGERSRNLELKARIAELEKENASLKGKVADLQASLTTDEERERRDYEHQRRTAGSRALMDRADRRTSERSMEVRSFALQHARAAELAELLEGLFPTRRRIEGDAVHIASDERNNSIIVTAAEKNQLETIEAVLKATDRPTETREIKIFSLKNAGAVETARIIDSLFQPQRRGDPLRVAIDARTNSVLIKARADQLKEIEAVIKYLDQPDHKRPADDATDKTKDKIKDNEKSS